ncbi:hypothetical protein LguiB_028146 [Lonicera macranthoides]
MSHQMPEQFDRLWLSERAECGCLKRAIHHVNGLTEEGGSMKKPIGGCKKKFCSSKMKRLFVRVDVARTENAVQGKVIGGRTASENNASLIIDSKTSSSSDSMFFHTIPLLPTRALPMISPSS